MKMLGMLALLVLGLTSCAATAHLNTPSGQPQVTIPTVDRKLVINTVLVELAPSGWVVTQTNDFSVMFERPVDAMDKASYNSDARYRLTLTLVEMSSALQVNAFAEVVASFQGSGLQSTLSGVPLAELQQTLERVRAKLGGAPVTETAVAEGPAPTRFHPPKPSGVPQ